MACRGVVLFQGEQHGRCESALMTGRHLCACRYEIKQGGGYRAATRHRGWPFFWLLFFGHAKKSDSPSGETLC